MSAHTVVSVRIPDDLAEELDLYAESSGISRAAVHRVVLAEGLKALGQADLEHLRVMSMNAKAEAIRSLHDHMQAALKLFREEE